MIKIKYPSLCSVKAVTVLRIVEILHRCFNLLLNITILRLKVK